MSPEAQVPGSTSQTSLGGWLLRDLLIACVFALLLWAGHAWHVATDFWLSAVSVSLLGFIVAYASCYILHEWGHLIGARLAGARLPLGSYKGLLLGMFDTQTHTRAQFQSMSFGGVTGYLTCACMFVGVAIWSHDILVLTALAAGGIAFVAQSLSVDLPIIWRVASGEDVTHAATTGATPAMILRRTWQSWLVLAGTGALFWAANA